MRTSHIVSFLAFLNLVKSISFDDWLSIYKYMYPDRNSISIYQQSFEMNSAFVSLINHHSNFSEFKLDLNMFADLNYNIFERIYLGLKLPDESDLGSRVEYANRTLVLGSTTTSSNTSSVIPDSVDYRNYSLPVQDQQNCGGCWAYAVASNLEIRMKMLNSAYNVLLSEQYFIDCDFLNSGCNGGWPYTALYWLVVYGGNAVPSLSTYPNVGYKDKCLLKPKIPMKISSIVQNNTAGNELMMKQIIANVGPVSAAVHATPYFQFYSKGILNDYTCDYKCNTLNHAVVIVGYGTDAATKKDYWIVKNTWGTTWGQQGYLYMTRNKRNQCNIACWAMYAV